MARITVEDCLQRENNRFALVQLAAKRTKQILNGARLLIDGSRGNKPIVNSLREIAKGKVRFMTEEEAMLAKRIADEKAAAAAQAAQAAVAAVPAGLGDELFIKRGPAEMASSDSSSSSSEAETPASTNGAEPVVDKTEI